MGVRTKKTEESSDESHGSINDNKGGWRENAEGERDGERSEITPNRRRRVELPTCEGLDTLNWINREEKFFEIQKVAEAEKIAHISMEGSAGLKEALLIRFESRHRVRQTVTMEVYVREFEALAGQTKEFSDNELLREGAHGDGDGDSALAAIFVGSEVRPQQHWIAKLLGYDFEIVYKTGATNKVADALSQKEREELEEGAEKHTQGMEKELKVLEVVKEVEEDEDLKKIVADITKDPDKHSSFTMENGRLHYKGRLVILAKSDWVPKLLAEYHTTPTGGHSGVYRTYRRIAQSLFLIGMKVVTEFVAQCLVCQQHKYLAASPQGLLQPLPIPQAIWEDISMDFIVRLPKSKGCDAILVVVDRLSKYGHFIPLKHPYTARIVAEAFVREVVKLHRVPKSIVSDRDPWFLSSFWRELFKLKGTQLQMSTSYHPEIDDQIEVLNRVLEGYLRSTPFEVVYGRTPLALARFVPGEMMVEVVAQELQTRDEAVQQLRFHLRRAQDMMVKQANRKRRPMTIKIRPHRQTSMPMRLHPKFTARYHGPFRVIQKVGEVAFRLLLPESATIHPVFHVSQLKLAIGTKKVEKELPADLQMSGPSCWPTRVIDRCVQQQGGDHATWEDRVMMQEQFPEFNLGDKVDSQGGSSVRTWRVYERRKAVSELVNCRPGEGG
ncbi:hypothetical protein V8G54_009567 [Vigna mungo]|uniref:Integrase catalytic domain-containing protein n=1 Tax=Vigna mungo TaxID=3915 RepID=A0AAQ3NWE5_VIGMU